MNNYHTSVLLREVIDQLVIRTGAKYIDATLGGGGHTAEILKHGGIVLSLDVDEEAIDFVKNNFQFQIVKGNFKDIGKIAKANGFDRVSGIIFDLGVSGHQFESAGRGFSFQREGQLDMRMDRDLNVKAQDLLNILTKGELYEVFTKYGEERFSLAIAKSIVDARRVKPIETTIELSNIIDRAIHGFELRSDTKARIFQALRIVINDELESLKNGLKKAYELLESHGRIAVISFHSLEDRIVKENFANWAKAGKGVLITKKPISPSIEEVERNSRSRSAKLRVFEKL